MSDLETRSLVAQLDDPRVDLALVGGKAASLAKLVAAGLPVPGGFCVTTEAYRDFVAVGGLADRVQAVVGAAATSGSADRLAAASRTIAELFADTAIPVGIASAIKAAYQQLGDQPAVAVRSSATAEDLPGLSFAGQQDTFLNVCGADEVLGAVRRCWASLWTARAIDYRARNGIDQTRVALAVVVQRIVPAEAAGVLFTADPVSGARERMVINAAWGLGESVVSGRARSDRVVLDAETGRVLEQDVGDKAVMTVLVDGGTAEQSVPPARRRLAVLDEQRVAELAGIGRRIADVYGQPMDIEWAIAGAALFVLQARPITTATLDAGDWNESLTGDFLWSNGNLGEAIPDVMTPCTWSLVQIFLAHAWSSASIPGYRGYGVVGGRFYLNLSVTAAVSAAVGIGRKRFAKIAEPAFGRLPPGLEIPRIDLPRLAVLRRLLPTAVRALRRTRRNLKRLPAFVATAPDRCDKLRARISEETDSARLGALWVTDVGPFFETASDMLEAGRTSDPVAMIRVRTRLRALVGSADAEALTAGLHTDGHALASLGPVYGLGEVLRGELDAATYARRYGHRSPHEFEVSMPRPAEEPGWVERQIEALRTSGQDPSALLDRQRAAHAEAWARLERDHPRRVRRMRRMIERWARAARDRESARSEVIRAFWVARAFVLRAGALTDSGEDVFFLKIEEILDVLGGDRDPLRTVPERRATYLRYRALGPYPNLIRGRFDPFRWAADPERRTDFYDETGGAPPAADTVTGFPGAAGVVQGRARVIADVADGGRLRPGEILVTTVTNIGWTPLFPRVAAVVTDVGAPLSHAAIVARELGIPAVVGCGNATARLHTGDRLRVDGERGTVEVLAG